MKILITGGNGYIAKSLYSSLKNSYEITTLTRNNFDLNHFRVLDSYLKHKYLALDLPSFFLHEYICVTIYTL